MSSTLICHRGGQHVSRDIVRTIDTPAPTSSWRPLPHEDLIVGTQEALSAAGLRVVSEQHALARDGQRYFGVMNLAARWNGPDDFAFAVGLRNSHDKSMVAGLALGTRVFVCDNLAFTGEVQIGRKHTSRIIDDLPRLIEQAVGQTLDRSAFLTQRIERYKDQRLHDVKAHDLAIRAVDAKVISNAKLPAVIGEWRQPSHDAFAPRTAWSLFNAFTEVLKSAPAVTLQPRTARLHRLFDDFVGFTAV